MAVAGEQGLRSAWTVWDRYSSLWVHARALQDDPEGGSYLFYHRVSVFWGAGRVLHGVD